MGRIVLRRSPIKILICDDDPQAASDWAVRVRGRVGDWAIVETPSSSEIGKSLTLLASRQRAARESESGQPDQASLFDDVDIAFLDYDLLDVSGASHVTGRELAYLVRCYSECGLIVVLNESDRGNPSFNLRLETPVDHFADLRISSQLIGNPGLWSDTFVGHRPWSWPILREEVLAFERRVEAANSQLDEPILASIGLDEFTDWISRDATTAIELRGKEVAEVTFRDCVRADSDIGVRAKDRLPEQQAARVAAARVTHWLNNLVLPAQDPFIDAPHLVSRFPSLLASQSDPANWQRTTKSTFELAQLGLSETPIANSVVDLRPWVDRPLWLWPKVSENSEIAEVRDPWSRPETQMVFLEDMTRFVQADLATTFSSQVSSMNDLRFVVALERDESRQFIAEERGRAERYGFDWRSCDPERVPHKPASRLAE